MMTLVATPPNLVVNSELLREGYHGFSFFSVTPIGLVVLVLGIFVYVSDAFHAERGYPDPRSAKAGRVEPFAILSVNID